VVSIVGYERLGAIEQTHEYKDLSVLAKSLGPA
jgi:hypothetical protein